MLEVGVVIVDNGMWYPWAVVASSMDEIREPIDEDPIHLLGCVLGERDSPEGSQSTA